MCRSTAASGARRASRSFVAVASGIAGQKVKDQGAESLMMSRNARGVTTSIPS